MRAVVGAILVAGGLALVGYGIVGLAGKKSCDERISRGGDQLGANCEGGTGTKIGEIVGGAFVSFGGLALYATGRGRRPPEEGAASPGSVVGVKPLGHARSLTGARDYLITVDLGGEVLEIKAGFKDGQVPATGSSVTVHRRGKRATIDPRPSGSGAQP
jgi:hypothetical protein